MKIDCKFAFNSEDEKIEWGIIDNFLNDLDEDECGLIPMTIEHTENVERLKRHGYTLISTNTPNVYNLIKK